MPDEEELLEAENVIQIRSRTRTVLTTHELSATQPKPVKNPEAAKKLAAMSEFPFSKVPVPTSYGNMPSSRSLPDQITDERELAMEHYRKAQHPNVSVGSVGYDDDSFGDDWHDYANCYGVDAGLFFPERGASTREAKEVCRGCVVQEPCLEYALSNGEKFGIWGAMSERERRRVRRQRKIAVLALAKGNPEITAIVEAASGEAVAEA